MLNVKKTNMTNKYDTTSLRAGFFQNYRLKSHDNNVFMIYYAVFLFLIFVPIQFIESADIVLIAGAFGITGFVLTITWRILDSRFIKLRDKFYEDRKYEFKQSNGLQSASNVYDNVPPSVYNTMAYNIDASGFNLETNQANVLIYDYSYNTAADNSGAEKYYGVACMALTKAYPHIYLDSVSNGSTRLYKSSQRVDLEGNFNKFFKLYMVDKSAADTLTVLAPDTMQLLIDLGKDFDIEVKEHKVYIISIGRVFTQEKIEKLLVAADAIYKDFIHLENNYHPTYKLHGSTNKLKKFDPGLYLVIPIIVFTVILIFLVIFSANITEFLQS